MQGSLREERQVEAQETVGAHFQQDAGQDDRTGSGRFDMGIRQPGMQREHGHLDGKSQPKRPEEPELCGKQG